MHTCRHNKRLSRTFSRSTDARQGGNNGVVQLLRETGPPSAAKTPAEVDQVLINRVISRCIARTKTCTYRYQQGNLHLPRFPSTCYPSNFSFIARNTLAMRHPSILCSIIQRYHLVSQIFRAIETDRLIRNQRENRASLLARIGQQRSRARATAHRLFPPKSYSKRQQVEQVGRVPFWRGNTIQKQRAAATNDRRNRESAREATRHGTERAPLDTFYYHIDKSRVESGRWQGVVVAAACKRNAR